jgi:hypothetical protein
MRIGLLGKLCPNAAQATIHSSANNAFGMRIPFIRNDTEYKR